MKLFRRGLRDLGIINPTPHNQPTITIHRPAQTTASGYGTCWKLPEGNPKIDAPK